jgi:transcriptional regulator with XRE-family HTH domain
MITAAQLKAARALLGIDQRQLAEASGLSLPTIQRMEASEGNIRVNVDSLVKLITALESFGGADRCGRGQPGRRAWRTLENIRLRDRTERLLPERKNGLK